MAKQIIQMYDKYHSTKKVYPKIIKECLEEDVTNYIEGEITEATTGLVPVTANPELAGTEADLESIEIGDTKYKVGGGKQLYQHYIFIHGNTGITVTSTIINDSSTKFTLDTLKTFLWSNNFRGGGDYPYVVSASGYKYEPNTANPPKNIIYYGLYNDIGNRLMIGGRDITNNMNDNYLVSTESIEDKVIAL